MTLRELIDKTKAWLYAIPFVVWVRTLHGQIHAWNRWVGFLLNWLGHYAVCVVAALAGAGIGALLGGTWAGAMAGATMAFAFYFASELDGVIRRSSAPWWDHVGDLVGPLVCFFQVWALRP